MDAITIALCVCVLLAVGAAIVSAALSDDAESGCREKWAERTFMVAVGFSAAAVCCAIVILAVYIDRGMG